MRNLCIRPFIVKQEAEDPLQIDLTITDQTMPDMTGLKLAQRVLSVRKDLPIILSSGYSEAVLVCEAAEAGIRAVVTKLVTKKELAEIIWRVLDG